MKTFSGKLTRYISIGILFIIMISILVINNIISKSLKDEIKKDFDITIKYAEENIRNSFLLKDRVDSNDIEEIGDFINGYIYFNNEDEEIAYGLMFYKNTLEEYRGKKLEGKESLIKIDFIEDKVVGTILYPIILKENAWKMVIQKDYTSLYSNLTNIRNSVIIVQVTLLLILIIIVWLMVKRETEPLNKLTDALKVFGEENKSVELDIKGTDEISLLGREFNSMSKNILKLQDNSKEFFNRVTHELKTPLTGIKGYADLLKNENFDDEFVITAVERISEESDKMNDLIKNILFLSKGSMNVGIKKEITYIDKVTKNILKSLEILIDQKDIKIEEKLITEKFVINKIDFSVVINNLIINSINHSSGEIVKIEAFKSNGYLIFKVKNEFNKEKLIKDDIYSPFIKSKDSEGSGLGLYICKNICEKNEWQLHYNLQDISIEFIVKIKI